MLEGFEGGSVFKFSANAPLGGRVEWRATVRGEVRVTLREDHSPSRGRGRVVVLGLCPSMVHKKVEDLLQGFFDKRKNSALTVCNVNVYCILYMVFCTSKTCALIVYGTYSVMKVNGIE